MKKRDIIWQNHCIHGMTQSQSTYERGKIPFSVDKDYINIMDFQE